MRRQVRKYLLVIISYADFDTLSVWLLIEDHRIIWSNSCGSEEELDAEKMCKTVGIIYGRVTGSYTMKIRGANDEHGGSTLALMERREAHMVL